MNPAPDLEVRPTAEKGRGLFTRAPIVAGQFILQFQGWLARTPELHDDWLALQVDHDLWLCSHGDLLDDCANHSCDPNAGFVAGEPSLFALRDIAPGEEICFDYSTSLSEPGWNLDCRCGSPQCRGIVRSWGELAEADRARLRPWALAYLRQVEVAGVGGSRDASSPQAEPSPEGLGQAYASMLAGEAWQVDAGEAPLEPSAAAVAATPPPLERILEALLFVGGAPLAWPRAAGIIRGLTQEQFHLLIEGLNRRYRRQGRPYHIQPRGQGYVLTLRSQYQHVPERLYGGLREARLSTAAIDVLALVAYRQPAPKAEVDALRGADSGALLRLLVRRGLIQVVYRADANQREVSYGTTPRFLDLFGLKSLDDLPRTQDLQQI